MKTAEELKERFIKVWGILLWEYFQKVGHQTCDDSIFRLELNDLILRAYSEGFNAGILSSNNTRI